MLQTAPLHGGVRMVDRHDDDGTRRGHDPLGTHTQRGIGKAFDISDTHQIGTERFKSVTLDFSRFRSVNKVRGVFHLQLL